MPNRLISETSPYLLQHADNPVAWQPWGEDALNQSLQQDKPILLSIGYSACHWCHVMAHESFEDAATAAVMNAHFISIKVDREERPDLDQIYQRAHGMLTGRNGGWPLTMFLTPQQVPFFGGTYFPDTPRHGLPSFRDLLLRIAQYYRENRAGISLQSQALLERLQYDTPQSGSGEAPDDGPIAEALSQLQASYDWECGGFGGAPKFPNPAILELCLREGVDGNAEALEMALRALRSMAHGGIYDQLGGGFSRYSVDAHWMIPHFEKMLYDNAQLLCLYSDAWRVTGEPLFAQVVEETLAWAMREMRAPDGLFYSSLDADSEGREGMFYVWQRDEVRAALTAQEYGLVEQIYGLDAPPNFENEAWHLCINHDQKTAANGAGLEVTVAGDLLASARRKLFALREQRIRPGRDDKVLTSWNALMIKAMARAGRVFQNADWISAAQQAADAIHATHWKNDRLLATSRNGQVHLNAYLDDYAYLLDALLELLQVRYRSEDWVFAQKVADALLENFRDDDDGGFFFTSHDHEALIHRLKNGYDNATPAGNGIAAFALQRLGHLTGSSNLLEAATGTLKSFHGMLQNSPASCPSLLMALRESIQPPTLVILRGEDTDLARWQLALERQYRPHALLMILGGGLGTLPTALHKPVQGGVNAWVCKGVNCLPVIDNLNDLLAEI